MTYILKQLHLNIFPHLTFIIFSVFLSSKLFAQKPEAIKYEGHYKNIPKKKLPYEGYIASFSVSPEVQKIITNRKLKLSLKGFDNSGGNKIILYISDPKPVSKVKMLENTTANGESKYTIKISANADSKLLILNNEGKLFDHFSVEPNFALVDQSFLQKNSYSEAAKALKKVESENFHFVKGNYVTQLIHAYKEKLNATYGVYIRKNPIKIFKIASNKFDYSNFNVAVDNFIKATRSSDVNSAQSVLLINNALAVWERYAESYEVGKKAKVSSLNIDEINFNLAMGYLAIGDGEKLNLYWRKCLEVKGNNDAEKQAAPFVSEMIQNCDLYMPSTFKTSKTVEPLSENEKFNNMVLFKILMGHHLNKAMGFLGFNLACLPSQIPYVKAFSTEFRHKTTTSLIKSEVSLFGKYKSLTFESVGKGSKINDKYTFEYNVSGISEVVKNNNQIILSVGYASDRITEVIKPKSYSEKMVYKFIETGEHELEVHLAALNNGEYKELPDIYKIKYDEHYRITSMNFEEYTINNVAYDRYGNAKEVAWTGAGGKKKIDTYSIKYDKKGNCTMLQNDYLEQKSSLKYVF